MALVVEEAGVDFDMYLDFGSRTPTAELLSNQPASSMPQLAVLPPKAQLYYGASGDFAGLIQWSMNALAMLSNTPDSRERLDELSRQFDDLDFQSFAGSLKIGGSGGGVLTAKGPTRVPLTGPLTTHNPNATVVPAMSVFWP